jgi:hypothetical protein
MVNVSMNNMMTQEQDMQVHRERQGRGERERDDERSCAERNRLNERGE